MINYFYKLLIIIIIGIIFIFWKYKDFKSFDIPYVQFTITRGECSWYDSVRLIYDLNNKKLYVDKPQINLHYIADPEGKVDIKLKKEWNGKLIFRSK